MAAFGLAALPAAQAQEIPRPSISRTREAAPSLERPYNLKLGPISLTMGAGLGMEYVDNINLSSANKEADLIVTPSISMTGVWQATKLNSLEMRTTIGYGKYLSHSELDTQNVNISPDSQIRLNLFVGDVKFIFREQFSLQEDPITEGGVSGVAKLGRFTNTAGVTALWDLNDVIWSASYDHYNYITTGEARNTDGSLNANLSSLDHSTEQLGTAVLVKLSPTTRLGIEGTAAYTKYPKNSRADTTTYSIGPFLEMQLTRYTHLTLSGGYQIYQSQNGSEPGNTPAFVNELGLGGSSSAVGAPGSPQSSRPRRNGDGNGYYFSLGITHRLNRFYQDRLSISREFQIGLLSDRTETTSLNYAGQLMLNRQISLGLLVFYEDVRETTQFESAFGTSSLPDYQRYGLNINTSYRLTKKLNVTVHYQFTKQTSDSPLQEYDQNRLALVFGYQF